ncbi:Uncharacterized protein OBRU01_01246 [Operophtera brumata]|uniref:Uncharacterized protein n=1 Tax=Operophtera brumata TaxID=104452 RepID=A0A0L7LUA8_OPEBR|nr:Uncharacterized protein OBRU01_01246 [Operophtera brumata]
MRTLDISDRAIRTVKEKVDENGIIENDLRGKHSNHIRVDETVIADIKKFIEAIPRIESHYTRQTSSREFIDGGKTITELFRDFQEAQQSNNKPTGKYCTFYRVFTEEYNISFFQPRKDQCDFCFQYLNSTAEQKIAMQESYDAHLEEKLLSRQEKHEDRCKIDGKNIVLVFDLQAIVIEGIRGYSFTSDIAIDDVAILQGDNCSAARLEALKHSPPPGKITVTRL